ncbi:putative large exoprotein involved in heme utilization or adhesion of ShlA/HecA/FhaA family [Pseudomonas batumici]|uniref:Putative large exoprotein involved in heme utilization or adhesion of ShlA/HecA/FhaA family n=2 Tax=Pseudomonas batumici TaxID=226910 RepID=A0A0C2F0Q1_9PSED|nr:putative large exoprotein involved in heme utilization or adhesion of ShlA/HecA/FhaA family [Pseudomonas batumici]
MGGAAVSTAQRQQSLPDVQARSFQIGDLSPVAASDRQLTQTTRQVTGSSVGASAINVAAPVDSGSNVIQLPGYNSSTSAITQPGAVQVDAAHQAVVVPGVTPTLPVTQRDPLIPAIAPVATSGAATSISTLARVQGLPDMSVKSNPQKYLIETNPVLTDLKQFMSSDYLLSGLGYNPDTSAKRLGDGFYEQKLIQQAVVARTGQRFIDGQTSNEKLFKYLMDNAISSKQQLNLSVGVTLTSEQVAALTHDIVWMEKQVVNGEEVLVPVLYLANANNRLAPNGALIQGTDVTLIAGANLENSGTLRASNNLSAMAGTDLVNTGLIEAGNRLDLLAGNNLVNKSGGIIAGRDVSVTAVTGDVLNQRDVNHTDQGTGFATHRELLDSAARIEAANNLTAKAGRDVTNSGSVLQSGGDTLINAGRDINIAATESHDSTDSGGGVHSSSITQTGSTVSAGRDLQMTAGRDLTAIASQIDAKRDIAMAATDNLTLSSAADESHFLSKSRRETTQKDHVAQVATTVQAGGDVKLSAGKDLGLIASRVSAGDEAYLVAGDKLDLLSAQNSDYSLYDMKKRGSWGRKKTQHDEVTQVTNVGSEIKTGGNLTLQSGSDQHYQVAKLESGKDLTIESGGGITFEGQKDLHQESHEKSNSSLAWMSMKGEGHTDETFRQSQMVAKGQLTIKAVDGLKVDIKQVNQQTVSQAVDAMVKADPSLAWLKKAEARGDIDWRKVEEIHQSFKYQHSGLGAGAQLILAILLAAVTGGAGATLVGAAEGSITATIANVAFVSLETTAANSAISNKGNLGAVVKDTFSSDSLKNAAISGLTAGFTQGVIDSKLGGTTKPFNNLTKGFDLSTLEGIGGFAIHAAAQGVAAGAIKTAIGGGSLSENLQQGLVTQAGNVVAATAFNFVGSYAQDHMNAARDAGDTVGEAIWKEGGSARIAMHALFGGAISSATGGDFKTGAIAAGASQAMAGVLNDTFDKQPKLREAFSQIVGLTASGLAGGDVGKASWVALMADQYNRQLHPDDKALAKKLAGLSDGKYTAEQIEEQMRLSSVKGTDISAGTDIVASKGERYDEGGNWVELGSSGKYLQQYAKADLDIIAFIQQHSKSYEWAALPTPPVQEWSKVTVGDDKRDLLSGRVLDSNGGYREPVEVAGQSFAPRLLPCADSECNASGANLDWQDSETKRWQAAVNAKALDEALFVGSFAPIGGPIGKVFGAASEKLFGGGGAELVATLNGAKGVVENGADTISLYRKMSTVEAGATLNSGKLQASIPGTNSSKYLSESIGKVDDFQNKAALDTSQATLEFVLDRKAYDLLMRSAVNQAGSKGVDAIKINFEGIDPLSNFRNIGVPSSQLELFNSIIKSVRPIGK